MKYTALILAMLSFNAIADSNGMNYSQSSSYLQSNIENRSSNNNQSNSSSNSTSSSNSGNNTLTTGNNTTQVGVQTYNVEATYVPNATAPNIAPTSPCMGGTSAGGSGTGFGISFGTSWTDDECNTRETARLFNAMGYNKDALAILCSSAYSNAAPSCKQFESNKCHKDEIVAQRLHVPVCKE